MRRKARALAIARKPEILNGWLDGMRRKPRNHFETGLYGGRGEGRRAVHARNEKKSYRDGLAAKWTLNSTRVRCMYDYERLGDAARGAKFEPCHDDSAFRHALHGWAHSLKPDWYLTINFCKPYDFIKTEGLLFKCHHKILRHLHGRHYGNKPSPAWFAFLEKCDSANAHAHLLVANPLFCSRLYTPLTKTTYRFLWEIAFEKVCRYACEKPHNIDTDIRDIRPETISTVVSYSMKNSLNGNPYSFCCSRNMASWHGNHASVASV